MSDEPSSGYNESPAPRVGSTASIGALVAGLATFAGVDDVVDVVDSGEVVVDSGGGVDVVAADDSDRRPTPPGDPDEQAAASPMQTSRIAAARSDPARRTARTVPGAAGRWGA